jgi:hypothetical protein
MQLSWINALPSMRRPGINQIARDRLGKSAVPY